MVFQIPDTLGIKEVMAWVVSNNFFEVRYNNTYRELKCLKDLLEFS